MVRQDADKFMLRLPDGMRLRLKTEAAAAGRSVNTEVVLRLSASLGEEFPFAGRRNTRMSDPLPPDTSETHVTIRDWLAGQAIVGAASQLLGIDGAEAPRLAMGLAQVAYEMADAMLAERDR